MAKIDYQNPFYTVSKEAYQLPNGRTGIYYGIRGLVTVFVVPLLSATELVMVNQFRYLYNSYILEFPAGRVEAGESPEAAARRELKEEAGFNAADVKPLGWFGPCLGISDERCHVFLATQLQPVTVQLDATEDMQVKIVERTDFENMVKQQQIIDGMTLAAWQLAQTQL